MSRATLLELWRERQRPKHSWVCSGAETKGSLRGQACLPHCNICRMMDQVPATAGDASAEVDIGFEVRA